MELTPPRVYARRPWSTQVAIDIATKAHAGRNDAVDDPYINHPREVARLVEPYGPAAVQVAWLHDVVEDSDWTLEMLAEAGAPPDVVAGVDAMTKRSGETYADAVRRATTDPLGLICKAADNAHNGHPERNARVPDPTKRERLARKYATAREILTAAGAPFFTL